jgi:hypothetical protein
VVTDLGDICLACLLDLSNPSESLYWEAKHFLGEGDRACLFIAEEPDFRAWYETDSKAPLHAQFRELLKDQSVILYSPTGPKGNKRFAGALRGVLDGFYLAGKR